MVQKSPIEWCTHTSNPIKFRDRATGKSVWGCIRRSPGCAHCYSADLAKRYGRGGDFTAEELAGYECYIDDEELKSLLSVRRIPAGSKCFVGDMTDVFGEWVPFEFLDRLFAVFALRPDVVFQVLTKRPERMREYLTKPVDEDTGLSRWEWISWVMAEEHTGYMDYHPEVNPTWPLPNVWLGTSTENQHWLDIRVPELLATPAAVRFLSCEPLLGPLDFAIPQTHGVLYPLLGECSRYEGPDGDEGPGHIIRTPNRGNMPLEDYLALPPSRIEWVIVGGESGPKARPFDLAWARAIVSQCRAAGVAVFVKQLGAQAYDDGPMCGWPVALDWNHPIGSTYRLKLKSRKGGDMAEWPEDLRVREWPV